MPLGWKLQRRLKNQFQTEDRICRPCFQKAQRYRRKNVKVAQGVIPDQTAKVAGYRAVNRHPRKHFVQDNRIMKENVRDQAVQVNRPQMATIVAVADCKEKWKNLRACYTRHLKNLNRATPTGKHSKPYYLAEKLNFLHNFTKTKHLKEDDKAEDSKTEPDQDSQSPHKDDDESDEGSILETPVSFHKDTKKSRKEPQLDVRTPTKAIVVHKIETSTQTQEKNTDFPGTMCPDLAFLYSLLPDLKDMNGTQKRKFKMGILSLTNDILQENDTATSSFMDDIPDVPPRPKNIRTY